MVCSSFIMLRFLHLHKSWSQVMERNEATSITVLYNTVHSTLQKLAVKYSGLKSDSSNVLLLTQLRAKSRH